MSQKGFRTIPLILLLGWMVIVTVLSLVPVQEIPLPQSLSDKFEHMVAYGVMALLAGWTWHRKEAPFCAWAAAFLLAAGYGGLMEVAQALAGTGRHAEVLDAVANAIGAGGIWLVAYLWQVLRTRKGDSQHV